jgi:hypothetical protein
VDFVPGDGRSQARAGCTVRFAHGGWTDANPGVRKKLGDWPVTLERFVALADSDG